MASIAIITVVVVVLLTLAVFGLAWLAYSSCAKAYRAEVGRGEHDAEIERKRRAKKSKIRICGLVGSYVFLAALAGLLVTGIVYRANNENLVIGDRTVLAIESGSMSDFYDDAVAEQYGHDRSLQFDVGDLCVFETRFDLTEGEVYGYKHKNVTITHRLAQLDREGGYCRFRGDNNAGYDAWVPIDAVRYRYTGVKVRVLGAFVLYARSYFGIWSLACDIGIIVVSDVVHRRFDAIDDERHRALNPPEGGGGGE